MRQVRAKFRILSITKKYDGIIEAELRPVMNKKSENFEENKKFWQASPSGECHLTYGDECDLQLGAYYYIDMVPNEKGLWTLHSVTDQGEGSGEVFFSHYLSYDYREPRPKGMISGNLKIGIDGHHTAAMQAFGKAGTKWDVNFGFAEPSDG
jgi:hypothetical protein